MNIQIINYQEYSKLPIKHVVKPDSTKSHLEITTPTGINYINLTKINFGFLGGANEIDLTIKEVIFQLRDIENEAKDYLLQEWLKTLNK